MCGRYTLTSSPRVLREEFGGIDFPPDLHPRFNVAPTQDVLTVIADDAGPRAGFLRWGLIPFWTKEKGAMRPLINARSETVHRKPSFRRAFQERRCLVLADGFYEWQKTPEGKVPMHIRLRDARPFAFAGLWDSWRDPAEKDAPPLFTCTILTADAAEGIRAIHDRMPVMLGKEEAMRWIDPEADPDDVRELLRPWSGDDLEARPVSTRVNKPANDDPALLEPIDG